VNGKRNESEDEPKLNGDDRACMNARKHRRGANKAKKNRLRLQEMNQKIIEL
jgi:hypothetical protein